MIEEFTKAVKEHRPYHWKSALVDTPNWADFINLLNLKFNNPTAYPWDERLLSKLLPNGENKPSDILIYSKLDPVVFRAIEYSHGEYINNQMDSATKFTELLKDLFPSHQIKAIFNFVGNESKYWIHKDDHEVVSWHCVGQVEWRIYHDLNPEDYDQLELQGKDYEAFILNPGDLFYVPKDTAHQVLVSQPRASLILQSHTY